MFSWDDRRPRAFSLVELLVVVAIVGLLVSLLMPALAGAREAGRGAVCLSNLRSIGQGVTMYVQAFNEEFPRSSHTTGDASKPGAWLMSLEPLGVIPAVRLCPSDAPRRALPPTPTNLITSYATNDQLEPLSPGIDYSVLTGKPLPGGRTRAYTRYSHLPAPCSTIYSVEVPGAGLVDHLHSLGWTKPAQIAQQVAVLRHGLGANYLWCDGHASIVPWSTLASSFPARNPFDPGAAH